MNTSSENTTFSTEIMVSVLALAYNHENWIARAIDSFIMQKANFPIEILVHDDASTDRTTEIIRQYQQKYPDLVKPVYQTINQFSRGNSPLFILSNKARGKYLAICDCDDYWTDSFKLQKQVELLEVHPECSMAVAMTDVYRFESGQFNYQETFEGADKNILYFDDLTKDCYLHTSTYVIPRKNICYIEKYRHKIFIGDTALRFILLDIGPFVFLRETVSVYQITGKGIWTNLSSYEQTVTHIELFEFLYAHCKAKHKEYWEKSLISLYRTIIIEDIRKLRLGNIFRNGIKFMYLWLKDESIYELNNLAGVLFRYIKRKIK